MIRVEFPAKRLERFDNCGSAAVVQRSPSTGKVRVLACHCHDRWCIPCQRARSKLLAANLSEFMEGKDCRFVTLTLRHRQAPLKDQLDRLVRCFRNLRQLPWWRSHSVGGAAMIEIKRSQDGRCWHPHLHIIVEGKYIPQGVLSQKWLVVTGDSWVVDVRKVENKQHAARYVSKYCAQPIDDDLCKNSEWLDEAMLALRGARLCTTFGSWRGVPLEIHEPGPTDWIKICKLDELLAACERSEPWAIALHQRLTNSPDAEIARPPPRQSLFDDDSRTQPQPI